MIAQGEKGLFVLDCQSRERERERKRERACAFVRTAHRLIVYNPASSPGPVNCLSLCFGYCSSPVQWNCSSYTPTECPGRCSPSLLPDSVNQGGCCLVTDLYCSSLIGGSDPPARPLMLKRGSLFSMLIVDTASLILHKKSGNKYEQNFLHSQTDVAY